MKTLYFLGFTAIFYPLVTHVGAFPIPPYIFFYTILFFNIFFSFKKRYVTCYMLKKFKKNKHLSCNTSFEKMCYKRHFTLKSCFSKKMQKIERPLQKTHKHIYVKIKIILDGLYKEKKIVKTNHADRNFRMPMKDFIEQFIEHMASVGCAPASGVSIIADDKFHDYQLSDDPPQKKKGYYCLAIDGDFAYGLCGNRREGVNHGWHSKASRKFTKEEKEAWKLKRKEAKQKQALEEKKRHEDAAKKAGEWWRNATPVSNHSYIDRKQIRSFGLKVNNGWLIVPLYANGRLWNIQRINEDGEKLFLKGARISGCYYPIADKNDDKSVLVICEGYSTGASIRDATGLPVVCAMNAGNLKDVAQAIRSKYKDARIVIAADNDQWTTNQKGEPYNTGLIKAKEAATSIGGAYVIYPDHVLPDDSAKRTDWNDIAVTDGLEFIANRFKELRVSEGAPTGDVEHPAYYDQHPGGAASRDSKDIIESVDWRENLLCNDKGDLKPSSLRNVILMTRHHDNFKGIFRYNEFNHKIMITKCPPWCDDDEDFRVHELNDVDISELASALESYGISPDRTRIHNAIEVVAHKNKFHPARDYLNGLEWDGKKRLERWLIDYMGAKDDPSEYLAFIGMKWLCAAVKRVFEPGCKFDHILVMEGKQGRGKSTALKTLATFGRDIEESYFTDSVSVTDIQNKDTIQKLQGSIIVEMAELAGFSKRDDDEIKRWITLQSDDTRLPYARTTTRFLRQFVLSATTNTYEYLKDPTGNRRYWPVHTGEINIEALKENREQLWAEAVKLYKDGIYIGPTKEEMDMMNAAAKKRLEADPWEDDVSEALASMRHKSYIKTVDILEAIGIPRKERDKRCQNRVSKILRGHGWENVIERHDGKSMRVWREAGEDHKQDVYEQEKFEEIPF